MSISRNIAVVLFNLGGPDQPASIYPFLVKFFMDPAILRVPFPIRFFLARWIAFRRVIGPARRAYGRLGGKSPLLENTQAQARALELVLNAAGDKNCYQVHVCMRYSAPRADQVAQTVRVQNPDQMILLPLYPQFSTTTSGSSFSDWNRAARMAKLTQIPTHRVCCYPDQAGFIQASVDQIYAALTRIRAKNKTGSAPRILFSAHGLPEKIVADGDPYPAQCEKTVQAIVNALGIPNLDFQLCYQSRATPVKWIGPSTEDALVRAARDQVPVIIYPCAFVSEHVETLVEIEEEYRARAAALGIPAFERAETVMIHPAFIQGLAELVHAGVASGSVLSQCGEIFCTGVR